MTDRNVEFPNRYRLVKVPGTDDIYDAIPAPGEVYDEGTFIDKANLLSDATAASIKDATETAAAPNTPNDALAALAKKTGGLFSESIVASHYIGTGTASAKIELGFTPRAVYVCGSNGATTYNTNGVTYHNGGLATLAHPAEALGSGAKVVEITSGGFNVFNGGGASNEAIHTNTQTRPMNYIAFK